jgi:hypothetical protein
LIKISQKMKPDIGKAKEFLSTQEDKTSSWWDWWFGNPRWTSIIDHVKVPMSGRFWTGLALVLACLFFIGNMAYLSLPTKDTVSNTTT